MLVGWFHLFTIFSLGKARLFEFINALSDQPVSGSAARAVHSSGGAAGGVVSESQGEVVFVSLQTPVGSFEFESVKHYVWSKTREFECENMGKIGKFECKNILLPTTWKFGCCLSFSFGLLDPFGDFLLFYVGDYFRLLRYKYTSFF